MTTTNSDVATKQADPTAKNLLVSERVESSVVAIECIYTVLATEVVNDLVRLFKVPEGYRAIASDFTVTSDGIGGTSAIISIGTASNPDSIAAAIDITSASFDRADNSGDEALTPVTATTTEDLFLKFTTLTAAPTVAKLIVVRGLFQKA